MALDEAWGGTIQMKVCIGDENSNDGLYVFVVGQLNDADADYSTVTGGTANNIQSGGRFATISGGGIAKLFTGGPEPPCEQEGNVDGLVGPAGPIDVVDLTYLVAFLFTGGPAPSACP